MSKGQMLLEEVLRLPREEKELIYTGLMDDLDLEDEDYEIDEEQWDEISKRKEEVESGKVKTITWEEGMKLVRDKINDSACS